MAPRTTAADTDREDLYLSRTFVARLSVCPLERWIVDLRQKPILLGALLVLATLLLYGLVTHHEFVWDDSGYVTKNIHVSAELYLDRLVGSHLRRRQRQ